MSPTVFRERGFRFLFFSREEARIHVHVQCPHGEAKFWMEPSISLAISKGLSGSDLRMVENIIWEHQDEIRTAWHKHFHG